MCPVLLQCIEKMHSFVKCYARISCVAFAFVFCKGIRWLRLKHTKMYIISILGYVV